MISNMYEDNKKGAFDKLVAGLTSEDRMVMLDHINKTTAPSVRFTETEDLSQEKNLSLHLRFKQETLFYRIILWFRSIIYKKDSEKIYNEDVLASLARRVTRDHPGIVKHKLRVLDSIFYERLKSLKDVSDFFKPYFSFIDENPGDFYVFLSSFVTPQLSESINSKADPFSLGFESEATNEVRTSLLKNLDEILNNFSGGEKNLMYSAVSAVNWLKQFTKIPYIHFTSQFTNLAGNMYTCPYKNASNDFDVLASVFSNIQPVQNEILEAMLLFSQRKDLTKNAQDKDIEKTVKEFLVKANQHFGTIQLFISSVPIIKIGKIINEDYDWTPGNIPGAEGWFPSFRSQWRSIIDMRWNDWIRERKKNTLSASLKSDFKLDEFPVLKYRPWQNLWVRVPFSYELTGGFVSWYADEVFDDVITPLNEVMMEGVFIRSENRIEYSEGLNLFVEANNTMKEVIDRLAPDGEFGKLFSDFATNHIRTFQIQNQIDSMMASTESDVRDAITKFTKGAKMMDRVFHGMFDDIKDGMHETLQNFTSIKGHQNRVWREHLAEIRNGLKKAIFYITELEPIDAATSHG